jgi:hypothetical protein
MYVTTTSLQRGLVSHCPHKYDPENIGGVVAALLSEETCWVNGQRIEVSGGINNAKIFSNRRHPKLMDARGWQM